MKFSYDYLSVKGEIGEFGEIRGGIFWVNLVLALSLCRWNVPHALPCFSLTPHFYNQCNNLFGGVFGRVGEAFNGKETVGVGAEETGDRSRKFLIGKIE